ncbi:hypothetical protein A8L34_08935 [Bacillus sp. FJAT-27264]|uniref:DUF58 domain-containing protein n=1 Tax=Paenibacillus sp. (strain DSM 101736 / FJAT-27264) TaxID=1850362 RepID=UPI000807CA58|nr:DUF58 domain-containing protein [Bacillus sp. FJAT-27264]OBZ14086.1 hypothetical protein A8L34_08935 [Bacillus sp. FJAT-27264]
MALVWFILFVAALLLIISFIYQKNALKAISYDRYFSRKAVYEGEELEMVEEIVNAKLLPLPWLRMESSIATGLEFGRQENLGISSGDIYQNHVSLFYLRSYRHIKRRHTLVGERRGFYTLESVTMTTGDLFGFSRVVKTFPLQLELLVYPELISFDEVPLPVHSWLGELAIKRWIVEDPFLTAGIREYSAGDSMGMVNWKATARTGVMQVHKNDYSADSRLMICLNVEVSESMWRNITDVERIELGIRYAATVAGYALDHGIETGFICNGRLVDGDAREPVLSGPIAQQEEMLELLARLTLDRTLPMNRLLELQAENGTRDTDYLIITCHQGADLLEAAVQLMQEGNGVEWLTIPEQGRESA